MTKRDFILIAETIAAIESAAMRKHLAEAFSAICIRLNHNFNEATFLKACKVEK